VPDISLQKETEGAQLDETVMDDGLTLNIDVEGDKITHTPHLGWRERKQQVRVCASFMCLLPWLLQQSGA
jgi:hypothetical protein